MKRKIKSIFLFFVAMLFISIGFFNFRVEKENYEISQNNNEKNGDIELVNSDAVEEEVDKVDEFDYFSESRINRENRYSQMLETYQKIIDSSEMSSDQKGIAIEEIKKIENQKNGILVSENLIKNKGFNDVVVFVIVMKFLLILNVSYKNNLKSI